SWIPLKTAPGSFSLRATLTSGQAFRWICDDKLDEWYGVVNARLWRLKQSKAGGPVYYYYYQTAAKNSDVTNCTDQPEDLVDYFRLSIDLPSLLARWQSSDALFASYSSTRSESVNSLSCDEAYGIRLLRQDPVETLFAFITSANNNVPRISRLLRDLCEMLGKPVSCHGLKHWLFPSLETLAEPGLEEWLKKLGFGYRSKFIPAAARYVLQHGGVAYLHSLRSSSTADAREFLLRIPGVGNKVADCICLCSLDKVDVVPVDIHILRAAQERKLAAAVDKTRSLTPRAYLDISSALSALWGNWAGWAQAIDFAARMRSSSSHKRGKRKL
ncbi:hypothetical protein CRM22_011169, partial [Opisthorchis felineus]